MQIEICREPFYHIIIKNLFGKETNRNILKEAIKLKKQFKIGTISRGIDTDYRNNTTAMYDEIYPDVKTRKKSTLLAAIDKTFGNMKFREILSTSPYPLCDFILTDYHETQSSRYGSEGQKYDWHGDRLATKGRHITFIYYFHKEPKKFSGGQLQITNSPICDGVVIEKNPQIKSIDPQNDMCIIFSSTLAHKVLKTKSPSSFGDGRFSVNCWVGFK